MLCFLFFFISFSDTIIFFLSLLPTPIQQVLATFIQDTSLHTYELSSIHIKKNKIKKNIKEEYQWHNWSRAGGEKKG